MALHKYDPPDLVTTTTTATSTQEEPTQTNAAAAVATTTTPAKTTTTTNGVVTLVDSISSPALEDTTPLSACSPEHDSSGVPLHSRNLDFDIDDSDDDLI